MEKSLADAEVSEDIPKHFVVSDFADDFAEVVDLADGTYENELYYDVTNALCGA